MVSVAKPCLICDYHGLIETKCFFICIKLWFIFINTSTTDDVINMIIKHISS